MPFSFTKKLVVLAASSVVGLVAGSQRSEAAFFLNFKYENLPTQVITDNSPTDRNPSTGTIQFTYRTDAFQIDAIVASSNSSIGPTAANNPATLQQVNLVFKGSKDLGTKTFTVELIDDAFTFPGGENSALTLSSRLTGSVTNGVGATANFVSTASPDLVTTDPLVFTSFTVNEDAFSLYNDVPFNRTATPYTLSNKLVFTIPTRASALFTGVSTVADNSQIIPEANSLALLGFGGLFVARRRARA